MKKFISFPRLGYRTFSQTSHAMRHPSILSFLYWEGLDWDRIFTHYAIIDPVDPKGVLYLTEREYQAMLKVALSTETSILVIARPGDEPPADWNEKKIKDLSKISPNTSSQFLENKYWRSSLLPFAVSQNDSTMVSVDQQSIGRLIRSYCVTLASYAGLKLGSTYLTSVKRFIEVSEGLIRHQGINAYIRRLQMTKFALECYLAGQKADLSALDYRMRLTDSGIPVWLPNPVRQAFINRNFPWIRVWFSLLNIYRALLGIYPDPNFSSITTPPVEDSPTKAAFSSFCKLFIKEHKMKLGVHLLAPEQYPLLLTSSGVGPGPSLFNAPKAARLWQLQETNHLLNWMTHIGDEDGIKMYKFVHFLTFPFSRMWKTELLQKRAFLGKLSLKYEAAGKVRVFAMVDYWTQHSLLPLHKRIFELLETFGSSDATFDQDGSVKSFIQEGHNCYYSYDLKSATDMISIHLYVDLLNNIFGAPTGDLWKSLLVDRDFQLPDKDKSNQYSHEGVEWIRYTRGQPMGALSSWGSLALLHHMIVQFAAYRAGMGNSLFSAYRVLGDDVVIANELVAKQYILITSELQIPVSLAKSVISPPTSRIGKKGLRLFQFANQIALGSENVSPASLREEVSANSPSARLELIARLLERDWKRPYMKELSFYLRGLVPRKWYQARHAMSKGKMPLFMVALLPILLSPAVKDCGITGLGKYLAWTACLERTCNYADLLNHKLWEFSKVTDRSKRSIKFLSERARDLYVEIISSQTLNDWNNDYVKARRFGSEAVNDMLHWYLPLLEGSLNKVRTIQDGPITLPYLKGEDDWLQEPHFETEEDYRSWFDKFNFYEALSPRYFYEEFDEQTKQNKTKSININILNAPIVCAAREQYLAKLAEEVRSLLSISTKTRTSWMLDISTSVDLAKNFQPGMNRDLPLWLPIPATMSFALSTEEEFYTFGKVTSRDPEWDAKKPLVAEVGTPWTIPATFERLETLRAFSQIAARLRPELLLVRQYKSKDEKSYSKSNRLTNRYLRDFKKFQTNFKSLFLQKGGAHPRFSGV